MHEYLLSDMFKIGPKSGKNVFSNIFVYFFGKHLYLVTQFFYKLLSAHFEIKMSVVRKTTSGFVPKSPKNHQQMGFFAIFFLYIA